MFLVSGRCVLVTGFKSKITIQKSKITIQKFYPETEEHKSNQILTHIPPSPTLPLSLLSFPPLTPKS